MISLSTARAARLTRSPEAPAAPRLWGIPVVWAALAALLLIVGAWLLHLGSGSTFWVDEWSWILHRRGNDLGTFLRPHNDHLSLVPLAIYRVMFATVGLDHYGPYRLLSILAHCGCVVLVFVYARRRLGDLLALAAAASLLLLGPAWQNILWPFQIAWLLSVGAGVGALLALDRRDRRGDAGASGLLALSLASSGVGVPIALGVLVEVLLTRPWRRLWIVVAPLIPYAVWWQLYEKSTWAGHEKAAGLAHPLLDGLWRAPSFAVASAASALAALAGLGGDTGDLAGDPGTFLLFGPVLLAAAAAALVWRLRRLGGVPPRVLALGTMALAFWVSTAVTRGYVGDPYTSRYLYISGVLVLLAAADLARGLRLSDRVMAGLVVAVTAACMSNVQAYLNGATFFVRQGELTRAGLSALDVARDVVKPSFDADPLSGIPAGSYFAAERAIGTPALPPAALPFLSSRARQHVDSELIAIEAVAPRPPAPGQAQAAAGPRPAVGSATGGTLTADGSCVVFRAAGAAPAGAQASADLLLAPGHAAVIRARGGPVGVAVRRYGDDLQNVGTVRTSGVLAVPRDRAPAPWRVRLGPTAGLAVCGLG